MLVWPAKTFRRCNALAHDPAGNSTTKWCCSYSLGRILQLLSDVIERWRLGYTPTSAGVGRSLHVLVNYPDGCTSLPCQHRSSAECRSSLGRATPMWTCLVGLLPAFALGNASPVQLQVPLTPVFDPTVASSLAFKMG